MSSGEYQTGVSWKSYCDSKMTDLLEKCMLALRNVEVHLEATDKAVEVAREGMDRRLEGMNEFRESLKDQANRYVTKAEYNASMVDIRDLRESRAKLEGMATQRSVYGAYAVSIFGFVLTIIEIVKNWRG